MQQNCYSLYATNVLNALKVEMFATCFMNKPLCQGCSKGGPLSICSPLTDYVQLKNRTNFLRKSDSNHALIAENRQKCFLFRFFFYPAQEKFVNFCISSVENR